MLTPEQDRLFRILTYYYGIAHWVKRKQDPPNTVCLEGYGDDNKVRARWIVNKSGMVVMGWDPDNVIPVGTEREDG
jgi:hypothetical protein